MQVCIYNNIIDYYSDNWGWGWGVSVLEFIEFRMWSSLFDVRFETKERKLVLGLNNPNWLGVALVSSK